MVKRQAMGLRGKNKSTIFEWCSRLDGLSGLILFLWFMILRFLGTSIWTLENKNLYTVSSSDLECTAWKYGGYKSLHDFMKYKEKGFEGKISAGLWIKRGRKWLIGLFCKELARSQQAKCFLSLMYRFHKPMALHHRISLKFNYLWKYFLTISKINISNMPVLFRFCW